MKKLFIIVCIKVLVFSCSPISKYKSNNNNVNMSIFGHSHELQQVRYESQIPEELLKNMDKTGIDNSLILNEYEGRYINWISKIDSQVFNFYGKKVGFVMSFTREGSKMDYFRSTRFSTRYPFLYFLTVGVSRLYIFDSIKKAESGGYDAAIFYRHHYNGNINDVIKRLKNQVFKSDSINNSNMRIFGHSHELQVRNVSEIPEDLLINFDKMGIDNSLILNKYEGGYFNFIFKIDPQGFNLFGKKVGFVTLGNEGSKMGYFRSTRSPNRSSSTVGGSSLYIFDSTQKTESGGYDAAIFYWFKRYIPIDKAVKILKTQTSKK